MKASKSVCLSADTTTTTNKHQFLGITATFLRSGQIVTAVLGLCDIAGVSHTGAFLSRMLAPFCNELKGCGFVTIVTDSGSNIVKATDEQKWVSLNLDFAHRCTCHALHNSLVAVLPFDIPSNTTHPLWGLLKKCREFAVDVSGCISSKLRLHER